MVRPHSDVVYWPRQACTRELLTEVPGCLTACGSWCVRWAVGVVTYELLVGITPFHSHDQAGVFERIQRDVSGTQLPPYMYILYSHIYRDI